jgi:hypothetical protein
VFLGSVKWPPAPTAVNEAIEFGRTRQLQKASTAPQHCSAEMLTEWSGWPARALRWDAKRMYPSGDADFKIKGPLLRWVSDAPRVPPWLFGEAGDDIRFGKSRFGNAIVWPGFALDTAFYAAIALTLWSAPGAIRRRRRRASGHCPSCNYDLSGLPPDSRCPECATPTK